MGRKGDQRTPAFVDYAVTSGVRHLVRELSISDERARDLMTTIVFDICAAWARQPLYIPALPELARTARDERIWAAYGAAESATSRPFTHARILEISVVEQIAPRHVYSILQLQRQREQVERQGVLPGI